MCNPLLKVKAFGTTLKRTSFMLFVFFSVCNTWRIVRVFQILILGFWSLILIRSVPVSLYTIVNFPLVSSDIGLSFGPYIYHTRVSCPVLSCLVTSRVAWIWFSFALIHLFILLFKTFVVGLNILGLYSRLWPLGFWHLRQIAFFVN